MEDQPTTLATRVAVGPDTDAGGVAAATLRLRRELPGLGAGAVELPQAGELPPGARAMELAAPGAPVVSVAQSPLLTPLVAAARPALPPPGSTTARHPQRAGRRLLVAGPLPKAAPASRRGAGESSAFCTHV
jgi:hypothetical protein